jgi:hypothetical protein
VVLILTGAIAEATHPSTFVILSTKTCINFLFYDIFTYAGLMGSLTEK